MCPLAITPTSILITSLACLAHTTLHHVAGEDTNKSLLGPGVSVTLTLLQDSALFGEGGLTQQCPSISLTLAVGDSMMPLMLTHNSGSMIPVAVTKH
jgi:hypothetical protein